MTHLHGATRESGRSVVSDVVTEALNVESPCYVLSESDFVNAVGNGCTAVLVAVEPSGPDDMGSVRLVLIDWDSDEAQAV